LQRGMIKTGIFPALIVNKIVGVNKIKNFLARPCEHNPRL
jgi:hypothetical protein